MLAKTLVVSLFLTPALLAQTGTYSTFGSGCSGSTGTGPGCISANYNGSWGGNGGVATFALGVNSGNTTRLVCGFELYAATTAGSRTLNAYLYSADAAGKPSTVLKTTTINWTATPQWHRAKWNVPVVIRPNTKFFIGFQNPGKLPYMSAGPDTVEHWHSGPSWRGPFRARWNYNVLCCGQSGGAVPALSATGVPSITQKFSVNVAKALPRSVGLLVLGGSNSSWGTFKLPLDLTAAGAAGCSLLVSYDLFTGVATDANGAASIPYAIPNDKRLVGVQFYNQWVVLDKNANTLGLAFSDGGAGKIGT